MQEMLSNIGKQSFGVLIVENIQEREMSEQPWSVVTGKRNRNNKGGGRGAFLKDGESSLKCNIQAKAFEMWGNGKIITIKETCKGKRWINSFSIDGGLWLIGKLHEILQEEFSKQEWSYANKSEWFLLCRDKNKGGEFIKLSIPDSKGFLHHCYFPMGRNKQGWREFCKLLQRCCNYSANEFPSFNPTIASSAIFDPPPNNCWKKAPLVTATSSCDPLFNYLGNWNLALKLEVKALNVDWSEIGGWLQNHMDLKRSFKIWPLSYNEAIFFAFSPEEKNRILSVGSLKVEEVDIKFTSWSTGKSCSLEPKISNAWIVVSGVPQHEWDSALFNTIGAACGGLLAISHETRTGEVISEIRLKVKGPISPDDWSLGLAGKQDWLSARISLAEKQVEHSSGIYRSLVFEPESLTVNTGSEEDVSLRFSRLNQGQTAVLAPLVGTLPLINVQLPRIKAVKDNSVLPEPRQKQNSNLNCATVQNPTVLSNVAGPLKAHLGFLPKDSIGKFRKSKIIESPPSSVFNKSLERVLVSPMTEVASGLVDFDLADAESMDSDPESIASHVQTHFSPDKGISCYSNLEEGEIPNSSSRKDFEPTMEESRALSSPLQVNSQLIPSSLDSSLDYHGNNSNTSTLPPSDLYDDVVVPDSLDDGNSGSSEGNKADDEGVVDQDSEVAAADRIKILVKDFTTSAPMVGFSYRQCEVQLGALFRNALQGKNTEFLNGFRDDLGGQ